jgi:hypothetical protein
MEPGAIWAGPTMAAVAQPLPPEPLQLARALLAPWEGQG